MTLIDTSAWIEFLRGTGSDAHVAVRQLIERDTAFVTTDVVVMEVLAGARDEGHREQLRRLVLSGEYAAVAGMADYEAAAYLFTECRRAGETVRALTDCLIAVVALREKLTVLHDDRDFDVLARHAGLRTQRGIPAASANEEPRGS